MPTVNRSRNNEITSNSLCEFHLRNTKRIDKADIEIPSLAKGMSQSKKFEPATGNLVTLSRYDMQHGVGHHTLCVAIWGGVRG